MVKEVSMIRYFWARPFGSGCSLYLFCSCLAKKDAAAILRANKICQNFIQKMKNCHLGCRKKFIFHIGTELEKGATSCLIKV